MWYNNFRSKKSFTLQSNSTFLKKSSLSSTNLTPFELIWATNKRLTFSNKTSLMLTRSPIQLIGTLHLNKSISLYLRLLFNTYNSYYLHTFLILQSLVLTAQSNVNYKTHLLTRNICSLTPFYSLFLSKLL